MTARVHRVLTAILTSLMGISALLGATDPASLHVGAAVWAWLVVGLAVATLVVTAVRQAWDTPIAVLPPYVSTLTTGVGPLSSPPTGVAAPPVRLMGPED